MNEWEWNLLEDKAARDAIEIGGVKVGVGSRVRLQPQPGGDILDLALRGQMATVESIEEDYEGGQHICVVLDDDPGRDLGMLRQPGHRFFFTPAEIEPAASEPGAAAERESGAAKRPAILVAGIGNIFLGDDGFGVAVARRLQSRALPDQVRVVDFGIRGFDLACALQEGYDMTILVDAYPHGQAPGKVTVIEPDLEELENSPDGFADPHALNPMNVLRMARAMNGSWKRVLLVGCEPLMLGGEEGQMSLSLPVETAVEEAAEKIVNLTRALLQDNRSRNEFRDRGEAHGHGSD